MNHWLWVIPGAPLIGAALNTLLGGWWGARNSARIAVLAPAISAASVAALWADGAATQVFHQTLYTWMAVGDWQASFGLRVDRVSLVMVSVAGFAPPIVQLL